MVQLDRILVATDFSDFTWTALDYACALASRFESRLLLLHVVQYPTEFTPEPTILALKAVLKYAHEMEVATLQALAGLSGNGWDFVS